MTDTPAITPGVSVPASSMHPETQVVTAALHNSLMTEANAILGDLYQDYQDLKTRVGVAGIVCLAVGFLIGVLV